MDKVYVDKARLLRRVIVISWISLALCFFVKIFGGNFFEIMCESENYKALCEYADTHLWLKFVIGFISSSISIGLYLLAILQQYKFKKVQFILFIVSVFFSCLTKLFNEKFGIVFDVWLTVFLPMLFLGKQWKKYYLVLVGTALILLFEIISLFVKNMALKVIDDSTFISLIYMIDVYLMCFIYYLYRNQYKKE